MYMNIFYLLFIIDMPNKGILDCNKKNFKGGKALQAGVRNQFLGNVIEIKKGTLMAEVVVKAGDYEVTSVMTIDSLDEAGFKEGDQVNALVKAINVVLLK